MSNKQHEILPSKFTTYDKNQRQSGAVQLISSWVDHNGAFETAKGTLTGNEFITIGGSPGAFLSANGGNILPANSIIDTNSGTVTLTEANWKVRLDKDKHPPLRVQLQIDWTNSNGERHGLDAGAPPFSELEDGDFGEIGLGENSLTSATVSFSMDPFQIWANHFTGMGKKTERITLSSYETDGFFSCQIVSSVP